MNRLRVPATACALVLAAALGAAVAAQTPDTVLTLADASKLTDVSGIKTVAQGSQPGAGGRLNFVRPDGRLILMVNLGPVQYVIYARKGDKGITVSTVYPGVGEHVQPLLTEAQLKTIAQFVFTRE